MNDELEIRIDPSLWAGAWANWVRVVERQGEFMLDLGVRDPMEPNVVTVVARLALSGRGLARVTDELERAWRDYAGRSLPEEFRDE
jgi:hypothetical protein